MTNFTILSSPALNEKLLKALLVLLALKGAMKGLTIGLVLATILVLYSLIADALCEVTSHIAQLWVTSDSLTRLLMLCLAVYVIRKIYPYVMQLHKRGIV